MRNILLISTLLYLISCTSSDNNFVASINIPPSKTIKTSLSKKTDLESIKKFSTFLEHLSSYDMVAAGRSDLHEHATEYLPDSTISSGYDMHIQEIGRIDTFRLIFHEYFDIYDDWSKTYLTIFSTGGTPLYVQRLWELSFEGNTNINLINNQIIEISYHDFFQPTDHHHVAMVSTPSIKKGKYQKIDTRVEGTIYEYYKIDSEGSLNQLNQSLSVSLGRQFPQSSAKLLSKAELEQYSIDEIQKMKWEIKAEHGYQFQDSKAAHYFESKDWYLPINDSVDSLLSDIERLNLQLLEKAEMDY